MRTKSEEYLTKDYPRERAKKEAIAFAPFLDGVRVALDAYKQQGG